MEATFELVPPARLAAAPPNKWLVTLSITFGTLMGAIDSSIVNVALPHIRGAVGATVQEITWITTGYSVALVVVMPLTAFLGRLFGQKRVYMACLALFLVGSALCGIAHTLMSLVIFRAIQGLGAGALQPTEQAILRQTFPPKEQGTAMAFFGMAVMLGPAIGPTLGGFIVDHWHWSWIFYINLPVGCLGLVLVSLFVQEDEGIRRKNQALAEAQRRHVDWSGIALLTVGLSALEYFLEEGARNDWFESKLIIAVFLLSAVTLSAFVVRELTAEVPAVDLRLFEEPVFTSGTLIGGLMFAMLMANMFLLPIFMQELLGFTATQSGLALTPRVLVMVLAMPIVGKIYDKIDPRWVIAFGVVLFAIGSWDLSHVTLASGSRDIVWALVVQGAGFACLFVPLTTVALSKVPRHRMQDATGMNSLVRQIGGAIGLAVFATMLDDGAVVARASIGSHVTPVNPLAQQRIAQAGAFLVRHGLGSQGGVAAIYGSVVRQSMVLSFERIFLLAGILFLLVLPLLLFMRVDMKSLTSEVHLE
ncbi:MAG: DHA2 family efflux MFS transporter permease subunit [Myxococcales bacterium]